MRLIPPRVVHAARGGRRTIAAVALCAATAFALTVMPHAGVAQAQAANCASLDRATASAADLARCGLQTTAGRGGIGTGDAANVSSVAGTAIQAGLSLIGVVFLILMIYGGIRWMTARGDSAEVEKARDIIKAAITGIIIVALAFAITRFIIEKLGTAAG